MDTPTINKAKEIEAEASVNGRRKLDNSFL
jgi:hypothetical protein